jgi:hypothetical protein
MATGDTDSNSGNMFTHTLVGGREGTNLKRSRNVSAPLFMFRHSIAYEPLQIKDSTNCTFSFLTRSC